MTAALKWSYPRFEGPNMYQKLAQRRLPRRAVMSLHSGGLAETLIWAAVDDEVDRDHKSLRRERER